MSSLPQLMRAGETVVVTGASGGVGTFLVQLARRREARVMAVTSANKADAMGALGADAVVARDAPNLVAAVRDAAAGPVDVVADVVGGRSPVDTRGASRSPAPTALSNPITV